MYASFISITENFNEAVGFKRGKTSFLIDIV
jgi:hypothetical protein